MNTLNQSHSMMLAPTSQPLGYFVAPFDSISVSQGVHGFVPFKKYHVRIKPETDDTLILN